MNSQGKRWLLGIGVLAGAFLTVNKLLVVNSAVRSDSMADTIRSGDRFFADRRAYDGKAPARGDIVLFHGPDNKDTTYVKRIIGLPGEILTIKDGKVQINGFSLEEPYLFEMPKGSYGPYEIPEGCYFVMGDNRNRSYDSRFWKHSFVKREDILGKAGYRYWPLESIGKIR